MQTEGGAPGFVVAAPSSGCGKTLITLGLMRAFRDRGVRVAAAKAGPDYIDPRFHEAACGSPSINLDGWAMRPGLAAHLACTHAAAADLFIVEGVMGLFDGADGGAGSTADLAAMLGLPVVLVLDVAAQAQTAAAVAAGLAGFRSDVALAGVVLNRVAGARHADLIRPALAKAGLPLLGWLPRVADLAMPSRHLGLVQASEQADLELRIERAGHMVGEALDLAMLAAMARRPATPTIGSDALKLPPPGQRVAVAADQAFAFAYPHMLDAWRGSGAEIRPFSPLANQPPDPNADAVFLPGGYPELFAGPLAGAIPVWDGLRRLADRGAAVHGECGGFMVLGTGIEDADGGRHAMAGLLPLATSMVDPQRTLGYRQAVLAAPAYGLPAGATLRGHEFHYARIVEQGAGEPLLTRQDAAGRPLGPAGLRNGTVTGAFFHMIDLWRG